MNPPLQQIADMVAGLTGIEGIEFDADGSISLEFDGTLITLIALEHSLGLQARLGHLSGYPEGPSFHRFLLGANAQLDFPEGVCSLSIDTPDNAVELSALLTPLGSATRDTLAGALSGFYELTQQWSVKLNEFSRGESGSVTAEAELTGEDLLRYRA